MTNVTRKIFPARVFPLESAIIPNYKLPSLGPWLERRVIKIGGNISYLCKSFHEIS